MDIVKNRNYLLLLIGRVVTNIGDSLYYVTTMWLVYKLGGNAFYTGLAGFLTLLPASLQFITGPFVDQWQVKKTLIVTQLTTAIVFYQCCQGFYHLMPKNAPSSAKGFTMIKPSSVHWRTGRGFQLEKEQLYQLKIRRIRLIVPALICRRQS